LRVINHPNQKIAYVELFNEVYAVPFIIEDDGSVFLKTIYTSRKAHKLLLNGSDKIARSSLIEAINSKDNK